MTATAGQGLVVTRPGFFTLLQDSGRRGVMHLGLAAGGAMDRHAWAWANRLLGNTYDSAALEITFGNVEFTSELDTQIAVTGADAACTVNGEPRPLWSTLRIRAGDRVALGVPKSGIRSYIAVLGGFQVSRGLGGSCASFIREGMGSLNGDGCKLAKDDHLPCLSGLPSVANRKVPEGWRPDYKVPLFLPVILGAQVERFSAATLETFFQGAYTISPQFDRMGARLKGPALEVTDNTLISEGTSLGAIQVPSDGQPIVLLHDRQTIGGYPKLGAVTPRGLDALAQRPPGTEVRFSAVALHQAQREEHEFLSFFNA